MKTQINVKECGIPSGSVGLLLAESKSILCLKFFKLCHERIQRGGGGAGGSNPP